MAGELWQLDGMALAALIRAGKVSAREAVTSHLDRLHAVNPRLNAIVRVLDEQALAEADAADRALRAGEAVGSLHGLPVTTKVNSDQAGLPSSSIGWVRWRTSTSYLPVPWRAGRCLNDRADIGNA